MTIQTLVRWATAPPPGGCRWCGVEARLHGLRWVPSRRGHRWEPPTRDQIIARLAARLRALHVAHDAHLWSWGDTGRTTPTKE